MTQEEFNRMLAVGIAQGLPGSYYTSRFKNGEEIDRRLGNAAVPAVGENILINADFRHPVNRNGRSEYASSGYTIDRWRLFRSGSLSITSTSIVITPNETGLATFLIQHLENPQKYVGRKMTLSFLIAPRSSGGEIGVMTAILNNVVRKNYSPNDELVSVTFNFSSIADNIYLSFNTNTTKTPTTVIAAKLELGDKQTLAHQDEDGDWVLNDPPNYDLQYLLTSLYSPITGEFIGSQITNRNLLDNWYFMGGGSQQGGGKFPINQRGATRYTHNGYSVDRWYYGPGTDGNPMTISNDGITMVGVGDTYLRQRIENFQDLKGKSLVFSVLGVAQGNFTLYILTDIGDPVGHVAGYSHLTGNNTQSIYSAKADIPDVEGGNFLEFRVTARPGSTVALKAAKLEISTTQTLARKEGDTWVLNDPPPNYALELVKCQRYFQRIISKGQYDYLELGIVDFKDSAKFIFPLPTAMRVNPAISFSGAFHLAETTGYTFNRHPVASMKLSTMHDGNITLIVGTSDTDLVVGSHCALMGSEIGAHIDLSSDR